MCRRDVHGLDRRGVPHLARRRRPQARRRDRAARRATTRDLFVLEVCGALDLFRIDADHRCEPARRARVAASAAPDARRRAAGPASRRRPGSDPGPHLRPHELAAARRPPAPVGEPLDDLHAEPADPARVPVGRDGRRRVGVLDLDAQAVAGVVAAAAPRGPSRAARRWRRARRPRARRSRRRAIPHAWQVRTHGVPGPADRRRLARAATSAGGAGCGRAPRSSGRVGHPHDDDRDVVLGGVREPGRAAPRRSRRRRAP